MNDLALTKLPMSPSPSFQLGGSVSHQVAQMRKAKIRPLLGPMASVVNCGYYIEANNPQLTRLT